MLNNNLQFIVFDIHVVSRSQIVRNEMEMIYICKKEHTFWIDKSLFQRFHRFPTNMHGIGNRDFRTVEVKHAKRSAMLHYIPPLYNEHVLIDLFK
jgi:hypothetical protein